ncbi:mitochondrial import receptor subunit Tom22 [Elasticomyces elasticus]|uniref:Mitochondrial import receptor subunit Tom22 n=1 Tax=Exophiala sideris TaxID=1016849 RepID=A0ABR0JIU9_9EURO|nr:mitochondrial import receptor subunit Tom22 [Elasticomyces elasticus]KAK5034514.1 mitochondrial import receptor subunit Tom22 [Exophiala sideris]KAK5042810.1 mitochondrial import receptor subunit Tom22 [Exophiala sideris]KAK5065893.1 mitochondrial import receptor subunit Tom22 [Exophiala sideris]KAK5185645.1 mitochondrial import receptor subunit Tom22 [Eurotiomycetes sp. CCFEE 6388]
MVKLEVLEDEHFVNKPEGTTDGEPLLVDDDEDYTDTDSEISDDAASESGDIDESLYDRIIALRDIIPPKARARISSVTSSLVSATSTTVNYSGKGLWVIATSVLLLGIPYALALGDEQQFLEQERQQMQMSEGAAGLIQSGSGGAEQQQGQVKASL